MENNNFISQRNINSRETLFLIEENKKQPEIVSEVFRESISEKSTSETEIQPKTKEQLFFLQKEECLTKLETFFNYTNDNYSDFVSYIGSLDNTLSNDLEIFKKIYEVFLFSNLKKEYPSNAKLYEFGKKCNICLLNTKINNPEIVKFLILNFDYFGDCNFYKTLLREVVKDKEFILQCLKKGRNTYLSFQMKEYVQEDRDLLKLITAYFPQIPSNFKIELKEEELMEILEKSEHPFVFMNTYFPHKSIKEVMSNKTLFLRLMQNCKKNYLITNHFEFCVTYHKKGPIFNINSTEDRENLEKLFFSNKMMAEKLNNFPALFVDYILPEYKWDKETCLKCLQGSNENKDQYLPKIEWLSDLYFLDEVCKICPSILKVDNVRKYLKNDSKILTELFKDRAQYLIYFYDDKETILKEANHLSMIQLKSLINEIKYKIQEDRDTFPTFYRSLEKSLREILTKRKTESAVDIYFYFR